MAKALLVIISIGLTSLFSGCYYDVEQELYGANCDTTAVTYSGTVAPMLQANGCLGCHAAPATAGNNIILDNQASIANLVQQNRFISGADRMPPSPSPPALTDCNMNKLRAWANAGALNN
ncbi:MAG: hypothetical protein ACKOKB_00975 [Bacteroidota bacterium]